MKTQRTILCLLFILMIFGLIKCNTDKTPLSIDAVICWPNITTVADYDYLKNQYFFVDTFYVNYFEQGWSDDLSSWIYTESRLLRDLEVFISTPYSNMFAIKGIAVLNPNKYENLMSSDYDTVNSIPGRVEKDWFVKLYEFDDYQYDYARGFLLTNQSIEDNRVLAVSYKTDLDTIGTFSSEFTDTTKVPVFRLIKSRSMGPWHSDVWPLMMKNVYFLGDSMINHECFNIRIEYNLNGEHQTIQPVDPKKSYINLMGLDRKDENGVEIDGGDGIVDLNSLMINRFDGTLMFPGLHPFNPLPQSRFQIANKADIYETNSIANLNNNYRYDIVVTSKIDD